MALVACWPGAALSSRPELEGAWRWLGGWALVSAAGGVAGALLLLSTPGGAFRHVVPFLVVLGALALVLQPRLSRLTKNRLRGNRPVLAGSLFSFSAYNGYFGAGAGVMTLALVLLVVDDHVARANALKNLLVGAAGTASAIVLAVAGPVEWSAVWPLAAGMFVGSTVGPRLPPPSRQRVALARVPPRRRRRRQAVGEPRLRRGRPLGVAPHPSRPAHEPTAYTRPVSYHPSGGTGTVTFTIPSGMPDRAAAVDLVPDVSIPARDGISFGADVYLPAGLGPVPAIVIRQPYGRRTPEMGFGVVADFFARKGYACVVEDVRGSSPPGASSTRA